MMVPILALAALAVSALLVPAYAAYEVEVLASDLRVPWAIDFAPDGRIFFTERGGGVRMIEGGQVSGPSERIGTEIVEGGLLGIALDPQFADNGRLYVYHTYTEFLSTYNRVVRYTEEGGSLQDGTVILDRIPGGAIHDGGRIRFAPDGTLYVTTGEAGRTELSQDLSSLGGKILRINPDGSIPEDNPYPGSPVFAYGLRNPQGLDWDPGTGRLVISEHGPSGERGFAHDEINIVDAGDNHGWPEIVGGESAEGMKVPALHSGDVTWAPSGASFYASDAIPEFAGRFLVANLASRDLLAVQLDMESGEATDSTRHLAGQYGRLRDAAVHGDKVYVLTSNRDGRGSPGPDDDRILVISPVPPEIECNGGRTAAVRSSTGEPVCVWPASLPVLVARGWAR